jgi:hypothetical protein
MRHGELALEQYLLGKGRRWMDWSGATSLLGATPAKAVAR